mgnify:CR=1 FL=1
MFACCEAKITEADFESILKELLKTDSEMANLIDFIKCTFLEKENLEVVFRLFLDVSSEYPQKQKKEPSMLLNLNRVLILILHMESKQGKSQLIQLVMDHFEQLLQVLSVDSPSKMVVEGGGERKVYGLARVEILRLVHHCLMINHKNFNLMVSMSKFGEILSGLLGCFGNNSRFVSSLLEVIELTLETNHKPLISQLLTGKRVVFMISQMQASPNANEFLILKLLRSVDVKFEEKCRRLLDWPPEKKDAKKPEEPDVSTLYLTELQQDETFEIFQIKVYPQLKRSVEIYFNLEKEIQDRNNRKMSGSSIFSNNLIEDAELNANMNRLPNSVDSDEANELEGLNEEDFQENGDDGRDSYGGIVRRRKMSEDNIKVGRGRGFGADLM